MFAGHLPLQTVLPRAWLGATAPPPRVLPLTAVRVEVLAIPTEPTNTRAICALACPYLALSIHKNDVPGSQLTAYIVQVRPQTWPYSPIHSTQDHSPIPTPSVHRADFSSYPRVLPTSTLDKQAHPDSSSRVASQASFRSAYQPPPVGSGNGRRCHYPRYFRQTTSRQHVVAALWCVPFWANWAREGHRNYLSDACWCPKRNRSDRTERTSLSMQNRWFVSSLSRRMKRN